VRVPSCDPPPPLLTPRLLFTMPDIGAREFRGHAQ